MSGLDLPVVARELSVGVAHTKGVRVNGDDALRYALSKPGAWADEPWEGDQVAKVADKIFCFGGPDTVGVKCGASRDEADEWLHRFPDEASVMAYIGRNGWNTLKVGGAIGDDEIVDAIDGSYELVASKLPKSRRPDGWDA